MKIIYNTDETLPTDIPEGTKIWEIKDGKPIYVYEIINGEKIIVKDLVDLRRDWLPGEKEEYMKGKDFSKEAVIKFFKELNDGKRQNEPNRVLFLYEDFLNDIYRIDELDDRLDNEEK